MNGYNGGPRDPAPYIFTHCFRKTRFPNEAAAEHEARRLKARYPKTTDGLKAYECCFCEGWHVGRVQMWNAERQSER